MNTGFLQKVRRDESGTFIVLMALSLLGIFGFAALSIDIGHVYQQKRDMQDATDFASLAGVAILTNAWYPNLKSDAIAAALTIAESNGVTAAEIAAGDGGTGAIQVGTWNTNNTPPFTANTSTLTWNAVRVPAQRTVGLFFGMMTVGPGNGMAAMKPAVHSVAEVTGAGSAFGGNGAGLIPFAITPAQATNAYFVPYSFNKHSIGSGNFGKLDLSSIDPTFDWSTAMTDGCNCTLNLNDFYGDSPGNAGISAGFQARLAANPYVIFPVFAPSGSGNSAHGDVITGFVTAKLISVSGNGNWTVTAENVPSSFAGGGFGGSGGGSTNAPLSTARVLVQ
jgi:Flp pilus assembly protein TadG